MRHVFHEFLGTLDPAPVRTWSLILTFYGDFIMPRGGELWLGTLSQLLAALEIKPNSVRAAMSRLERDGFLTRRRVGRTSHYALSSAALALSHEAEAIIYRTSAPVSEPGWDIIVTSAGPAKRRALAEEGFRPLIPGMFMRPKKAGLSVPRGAVHLTAMGDDARLARELYPLAQLAARYRAFCSAVPLIARHAADAGPLDAVMLRLALVHGFRRLALRDPHLCPAALPKDWPADEAHGLFAETYSILIPASEEWLDTNAANAAGPLDRPRDWARFGISQIREEANV